MNDKLKNIVALRKKLQDVEVVSYGFKGKLNKLTRHDCEILLKVWGYTDEQFEEKNNKFINKGDLFNFIGKNIIIDILTAELNYYETFEDFVSGNKNKCKAESKYYIHDIDYLEGESEEPDLIKFYKSNLKLQSLLLTICDYQKSIGGELELFFYKSENALILKLNYRGIDLKLIQEGAIKDLLKQFKEKPDSQERKQIFKNELISVLNKEGGTYSDLLNSWDVIVNNYSKSFDLYLSEFSFEKISTSSTKYFQDLNDKIHQTIAKVSGYIYAIPVAYVFLIKYFDFEGESFLPDFLILILGILFFLLIWNVAFKNISESFGAITDDIDRFKTKIESNEALADILYELNNLKGTKLKKQKNKLLFVKILSIIILLMLVFAFVYNYRALLQEIIN